LDPGLFIQVNNDSGQSTIEFILTFAFGLSLILLIFNSAMNHVTGYLVHYATFMSSRTYLTSESFNGGIGNVEISYQQARQEATAVFNRYNLGMFNVAPGGFKVHPAGRGQNTYLSVGTSTTFERTIDIMGQLTGNRKVTLISESFLGKEPTRAVCATRVCEAVTGQSSCQSEMDVTLYDDGC
jgi:hypothetical protein